MLVARIMKGDGTDVFEKLRQVIFCRSSRKAGNKHSAVFAVSATGSAIELTDTRKFNLLRGSGGGS